MSAIPFKEALAVWLRIGLTGFGGPAGQIALMHRLIVEERRWVSEARFLHALNYCMLLPGPEAQQLATYLGWLLHRIPGGLVAGWLFVLPGFCVLLALSALYAAYHDLSSVQALFFGLKAAVLALVIEALLKIGRKALRHWTLMVVAAVAFLALAVLDLPFPLVVAGAALAGWLGHKMGWHAVEATPDKSGGGTIDALLEGEVPAHVRPSTARAVRLIAVFGVLWLGPVVALGLLLGWDDVFTRIGTFFSTMAVVTFGGAYAVLAYVAQQAVEGFGWLAPGEMLDGLGLAETTPGPLILVLEFVGFLAAYRDPGTLPPMLAGVLGASLTVWVTFMPCFLWIFLGGPYVEILRGMAGPAAALRAVTAAVVGVIANLALWFGWHLLYHDGGIDWAAAVLAAAALLAMLRFRVGMIPTLAACALAGVAWKLLL